MAETGSYRVTGRVVNGIQHLRRATSPDRYRIYVYIHASLHTANG